MADIDPFPPLDPVWPKQPIKKIERDDEAKQRRRPIPEQEKRDNDNDEDDSSSGHIDEYA